jgi:hypothetical protein
MTRVTIRLHAEEHTLAKEEANGCGMRAWLRPTIQTQAGVLTTSSIRMLKKPNIRLLTRAVQNRAPTEPRP